MIAALGNVINYNDSIAAWVMVGIIAFGALWAGKQLCILLGWASASPTPACWYIGIIDSNQWQLRINISLTVMPYIHAHGHARMADRRDAKLVSLTPFSLQPSLQPSRPSYPPVQFSVHQSTLGWKADQSITYILLDCGYHGRHMQLLSTEYSHMFIEHCEILYWGVLPITVIQQTIWLPDSRHVNWLSMNDGFPGPAYYVLSKCS